MVKGSTYSFLSPSGSNTDTPAVYASSCGWKTQRAGGRHVSMKKEIVYASLEAPLKKGKRSLISSHGAQITAGVENILATSLIVGKLIEMLVAGCRSGTISKLDFAWTLMLPWLSSELSNLSGFSVHFQDPYVTSKHISSLVNSIEL